MRLFSNRKNEQCPECVEKFEKHNELLAHGQTIHNRTIIKCAICNKSFLYAQSRMSHQENHKVNLGWQIALFFLPIVHFWTFIRIKKFRKFVLVSLILLAASFIPLIIDFVAEPDFFNFDVSESPVPGGDILIPDTVIYWYVISFFGVVYGPLFFLIKWSGEWNKKINALTKSMSHDSLSQDETRQN